jgi:hypothetical protein
VTIVIVVALPQQLIFQTRPFTVGSRASNIFGPALLTVGRKTYQAVQALGHALQAQKRLHPTTKGGISQGIPCSCIQHHVLIC